MINQDKPKSQIKELKTQLHLKTSFEPISNKDIEILILGTIPGDKSIQLGEYYGHPRNRFWKIIATITNSPLPINYSEKIDLLLKKNIGLWDVAHKANRKGSLDSNILNELPNDLENFITTHKKLKVIGFNGQKSEKLYDKYFKRNSAVRYISLPSTSPANTTISIDLIVKQWESVLD